MVTKIQQTVGSFASKPAKKPVPNGRVVLFPGQRGIYREGASILTAQLCEQLLLPKNNGIMLILTSHHSWQTLHVLCEVDLMSKHIYNICEFCCLMKFSILSSVRGGAYDVVWYTEWHLCCTILGQHWVFSVFYWCTGDRIVWELK